MLRERQEVARQLIGGCSYSAGGKFYESLNAFVRVAKRTFKFGENVFLRDLLLEVSYPNPTE